VWPAGRLYAAAAIAVAAAVALHPTVFGSWIRVPLTSAEAQTIARKRIPNASAWRAATDFVPNLSVPAFEYLRRVAGPEAAQNAVREHTSVALWRTRFFRPLTKEEWIVFVNQEGAAVRTDHVLGEQAPGANLTPDEARRVAERALPAAKLVLVDSNQQKLEHRTDYSFTFEDPSFHVGEARARISVTVRGDEASSVRRFIKLPEAWLRDFEAPDLRTFVAPALIGAAAMPVLILFLRRIARRETILRWRAYSTVGLIGIAITTISAFNGSATMMAGYNTAMPEQNYLMQYVVARAIMVVLSGAALFAAAMGADVFRQAALGRTRLNLPSLPRAIAVAALGLGLARVLGWMLDLAPGPRTSVRLWSINGLDAYAPGWRAVAAGYVLGVAALCGVIVAVLAAFRFFHVRQRIVFIAAVAALLSFSQSLTVLQFALHLVAWALALGAVWLVARTCAADFIAFGVAAFWMVGAPSAIALIQQPAPWLRWNGVIALVALLAAGSVAAVGLRRQAMRVAEPEAVTPGAGLE
jgi:hypothetical protein